MTTNEQQIEQRVTDLLLDLGTLHTIDPNDIRSLVVLLSTAETFGPLGKDPRGAWKTAAYLHALEYLNLKESEVDQILE